MRKFRHKKSDIVVEQKGNMDLYSGVTIVLLPCIVEDSLDWEEIKESLFVTEDGVEIRDQDSYFLVRMGAVSKHLTVFGYTAEPNSELWKREDHKTFSTREKAEKYVLYTRPCLSLNDLLSIELDKGCQIIDPEGEFMQTALEIAKQKLRTNG